MRFLNLLDEAARNAVTTAETALLAEAIARYLFAVERRIDLDGGPVPDAELVAELTDLVVQHPLRES